MLNEIRNWLINIVRLIKCYCLKDLSLLIISYSFVLGIKLIIIFLLYFITKLTDEVSLVIKQLYLLVYHLFQCTVIMYGQQSRVIVFVVL
jgi:hypothetical protein